MSTAYIELISFRDPMYKNDFDIYYVGTAFNLPEKLAGSQYILVPSPISGKLVEYCLYRTEYFSRSIAKSHFYTFYAKKLFNLQKKLVGNQYLEFLKISFSPQIYVPRRISEKLELINFQDSKHKIDSDYAGKVFD